MAEQKFTDHILTWNDRRLDGRRREVDQALGQAMGGSARSGLDKAIQTSQAAADNPSNNPATRNKSGLRADMARRMQHSPEIQDRPTTVSAISGRYAKQFDNIVQDSAARGDTTVPGAGWYFEHRRGAESALPANHGLGGRQIAAMSAKLSASKTPEDERVSMAGIHELTTKHSDALVSGRPLSSLTGPEVAVHASNEAAWSSYEGGGRRGKPTVERPDASSDVRDALRRAGRAHQDNVGVATDIARGTTPPHEAFSGSTPKTAAYGEMIAASNPGSLEETDYKNIASHMVATAAGREIKGQGMMQFSKPTGSEDPHVLSPNAPTAIDTWMLAAGSGQPASIPNVDPHTGAPAKGRSIRASKRMVDKSMPLDASTKRKADTGLKGTGAEVTPVAAAAAQHMEAVSRAAKSFGPVSHNQHGQDIGVPSSLIQESVWTVHRQQAGADPVHSAGQRAEADHAKQSERKAKAAAKAQGKLF